VEELVELVEPLVEVEDVVVAPGCVMNPLKTPELGVIDSCPRCIAPL
jgi:hypothetical protein